MDLMEDEQWILTLEKLELDDVWHFNSKWPKHLIIKIVTDYIF